MANSFEMASGSANADALNIELTSKSMEYSEKVLLEKSFYIPPEAMDGEESKIME